MKNNTVFRVAAGLLIAANLFAFTACSQQAVSASPTSSSANGQTTIYGKVTAVDGEKVTLALGTFNQRGGGRSGSNSGDGSAVRQGTPPNKRKNSTQQGAGSEIKNSTGQGNTPNGGWGANMLTLTGESKTITISDSSILTKGNMRGFGTMGGGRGNGQNRPTSSTSDSSAQNTPSVTKTASLSDITIDTILKVTYEISSGKLVSVQIINANGGARPSSSAQSK